jgi:hypothetical protein
MNLSYKHIFGLLAVAFFLPALSFAQQTYVSNANVAKVSSQHVISAGNEFLESSITSPTATLNAKLQDRFSTVFPNAENTRWSEKDNTFYVSFSNEGKKTYASFDVNGQLNYTITECSREQLPAKLQKYLQKNYGEYDWFHAKQINAYDAVSYEVILENADHFITIRATRDGIEKFKQVNKVAKG